MSRKEDDSSTPLNSIFIGEVASVHNYGAFVRIPGSKNQGLIHRTQMSKVPVDDATEVLQRGDKVWCKVINITDDNKVGLSMKVVDQGTGKDLDPNRVQTEQDEQRRKAYVPGSRKKTIQLEAVFNTTCSKCGTHGHLGKDCFKSPDGKTYELIPEDDIDASNEPAVTEKEKESKTKKQKKKKKKHKKEKAERKEKKKKKKHKKHLQRNSSNSEESSNSDLDTRRKSSQNKNKRKGSASPSPDRQKKSKH